MFTIVDAVNQQIPANVTPAAMLVLTKFAELVTSAKEPLQCRVSVERFMAATHYKSKKQVTNILDDLRKEGYLKPLEDRKTKKPGDKATLYELCLPEGYDENIIKKRRCKYYGGKLFYSPFDESMEDLSWWEQDLTADTTPIISPSAEKISTETEKTAAEPSKTYPKNKGRSEEKHNNNRAGVVVVDSEIVRKAKKDAAEATGGSPEAFDKCGITDETARFMSDAIAAYNADINNGKEIGKPVPYLAGIFKNICKAGGPEKSSGKPRESAEERERREADEAKKERKKHIDGIWFQIVDALELKDIPPEQLTELWNSYWNRVTHHQPEDVTKYADVALSNVFYDSTQKRNLSLEELRAKYPDINARVKLFRKAIEDLPD